MNIQVGDIIPLITGDATILRVKISNGRTIVLAHRRHPHHQFATWAWTPELGGLIGGHYHEHLAEAEIDFNER